MQALTNQEEPQEGLFLGESNSKPPYTYQLESSCMHKIDNVHEDKTIQLLSRPQEDHRPRSGYEASAAVTDGNEPKETTSETVGEYLTQAQFHMQQGAFKAGKLSGCVDTWKDFTSDPHILKITRGFGVEFIDKPQQEKIQKEYKFSESEMQFIEQELARLEQQNVITQTSHQSGDFVSNIFIREKKDSGKFRMILNLKRLNQYVDKKHFKMDTLKSAINMVTPGCWFLSLDFQDAYYSVPVAVPLRKFLKFSFQGSIYQYNALPNGLSSAPRLFTKLLKVQLAYIRKNTGLDILGYLDDTLLCGKTDIEIMDGSLLAIEVFTKLGFTISDKKSVLVPTKEIEFLGFIINSNTMTVSLSSSKVEHIKNHIHSLLANKNCTIRHFANVLGKIEATEPANPWCLLYTKILEISKNDALKKDKFKCEAMMDISQEVNDELQWWLHNLSTLFKPIHVGEPALVIYTDASLEGWGCHISSLDISCGGRWTDQEKGNHINYLEVKAVYLAILANCKNMNGQHIRIMSDNTTTVAAINKHGSIRSKKISQLSRLIWLFAIDRELWLSAAHCPGATNTEAHRASRQFNDETEWTLENSIFSAICNRYGSPDIDLFAARNNHKVARYCAWQPDPGAVFIDAFHYHWGQGELLYMFPPF